MARLLRPCPLPSLVATNRANPSRNFEAAKEPRQGSAEHPTVHCMRDKLSALHANLRGCTQWPHDNCCIPNEALAPQPNPESIVVLRSFVSLKWCWRLRRKFLLWDQIWRIVHRFAIGQAFATNAPNRARDTQPVVQLPRVPAKFKFVQIVRQMFATHRVERAHDSA